MGLNLEQGLKLEQVPRLELAQKFSGSIEDMRRGTGGGPKEMLPAVVDRVIDSIESEDIKKGIHQLFENGKLVSLLKERMDNFAVPTKSKIIDFVIEYIFKENNDGNFQERKKAGDGTETLGGSYKTTRTNLTTAYFKPDDLRKQIEERDKIVRSGANVGEGMMTEIRELTDAENVMAAIRPEIDLITDAFTYVLVKKNDKGTPELSEFIKDAVILGKMTVVESDRLIKRFVKRCKDVGQKKRPGDVKEAFMNVAGEVTLITMGIIEQDMFTLRKAQIDPDVYDDVRKKFSEIGLDIDKVFGSYKQRNEGTFFWNRWRTVNQNPSRVTDEKIREFLTQTVREDEKAIFDSIQYENMIEKIKEINSSPDKDSSEDIFGELFLETFSSDSFKKKLTELLKTKWYKKLEIFYR